MQLPRIVSGVALTVAATLGLATSAGADSLPDAYYPGPAIKWAGFYSGVQGGAGWQNADTTYSPGPGVLGPILFAPALQYGAIPDSSHQGGTGWGGGATLGFNIRSGSLVYGIEGDASWLGLKETSTVNTNVASLFYPPLTTSTETKTDWLATLRGRAGVLVSEQSLLYVTGGLAAGHVSGSTTIAPGDCSNSNNLFCSTGSGSETRWGWTVGGGLEEAFGGGWSVKFEYLYYDLGRLSYTANEMSPIAQINGAPNLNVETNVTGQIARVGINYKF